MFKTNWNFPYVSQRMPIFARNMVATSHPLAVQAGLDILHKGGNAVDAAVASAITLTVVECTNNGIGGDNFAIVWDNKSKKLYGLNASGKSPASWNFDYFKQKYQKMPITGWDTVTIPGSVSGWLALSERFGKLPFAELFLPAIEYSERGFHVSPITARVWKNVQYKYKDFLEFNKTFLLNGETPRVSQKIVFKNHAKTLSEIAETKTESFYCGKLAEKIVKHAHNTGGFFTLEDLQKHQVEWLDTISINYRDYEIHEIPPNGQGIAVLIAMGILKHCNINQYPPDSADSLHLQIEAIKLAFADLYKYVSDPDTMDIDYHYLLNDSYLSERAKNIDINSSKSVSPGIPGGNSDTVYLATADDDGMMVSFIQSNYTDFGSGIVVPDTGISLQSRGACFCLEKNHPNQIAGAKKPFHTIIPAFVTKKGRPVMSFGVMGGDMQPQGQVQILIRIIEYHQNSQSASDALRWRVMEDNCVALEKGTNEKVIQELVKRGHKILLCESSYFGGAQLISRVEEGYCGASDHRKDGQASGY